MKKCPQCNRTYADEGFTFCLEDGTLLSPPYDPKSEEPISTIVSSEPPPTVALPPKQDQETAATRQDEPVREVRPGIERAHRRGNFSGTEGFRGAHFWHAGQPGLFGRLFRARDHRQQPGLAGRPSRQLAGRLVA